MIFTNLSTKIRDSFLLITIFLILAACLAAAFLTASYSRQDGTLGLPTVELEDARLLSGEDGYMEETDNAAKLLLFNYKRIPFDAASNTLYLPQSTSTDTFSGRFNAAFDNLKVFFCKDGYEASKLDGIREGHNYQIAISDGSCEFAGSVDAVLCGLYQSGIYRRLR